MMLRVVSGAADAVIGRCWKWGDIHEHLGQEVEAVSIKRWTQLTHGAAAPLGEGGLHGMRQPKRRRKKEKSLANLVEKRIP
jgi:hypothetical protein